MIPDVRNLLVALAIDVGRACFIFLGRVLFGVHASGAAALALIGAAPLRTGTFKWGAFRVGTVRERDGRTERDQR
jgi:hypothetical protein